MRSRPNLQSRACVAALSLVAVLVAIGPARGDDLTTLSGETFHDVRVLRVEPDGVTWQHARGVAKVDFADSPEKVRAAYHYEPGKAAAYHEAQVAGQRQLAEQAQQLLRARDEHVRAAAQARVEGDGLVSRDGSPAAGPTLVYRHGLAPAVEAAARAFDEQVAARQEKAAAAARNSEGLGAPGLWSFVPGVGSKPVAQRVDLPNSLEFTHAVNTTLVPSFGASQGSAGAFGASSVPENFAQPIYMTKSYNEDVDRAAAFARGTP